MITSDLIGSSARFRAVLGEINMVARADSAVLIQGETGTGKELVARAIHDKGPRRHNRFVAVNCAAIPSALLESELFGYERVAFTGAVAQRIGRFQAADHGTLWFCNILCVNCLGWIRLSVAGLGVKGARRATEAPQTMARR